MNLIHKEFLIALANGEEVECKHDDGSVWNKVWKGITLAAFNDDLLEFRIKPKTVTLSMEIPMPFVPKVGDSFWYFNSMSNKVAYSTTNGNIGSYMDMLVRRGVYRTENEAEEALAAQTAAIAKLLEGAK